MDLLCEGREGIVSETPVFTGVFFYGFGLLVYCIGGQEQHLPNKISLSP